MSASQRLRDNMRALPLWLVGLDVRQTVEGQSGQQ
jgi:hypothetical protein